MRVIVSSSALLFLLLGMHATTSHLRADEKSAALAEQYMVTGQLAQGVEALDKRLQEQPRDDEARFGLGMVQFLKGVERLAQSLHKFGLREPTGGLAVPFLRLPLPTNPQPAQISYAASREILQTFVQDLAKAEATLAEVQNADVKLPIHFGRIRLDLDGNGKGEQHETLWRLYSALNRGTVSINAEEAEKFLIVFDKADVTWLRGYCHLLSAMCEMVLAHDTRELFERTAHIFFPSVDTPFKFLENGKRVFSFSSVDIADIIAFIHLLNFPVAEPKRMPVALRHMELVISLSRQNWKELMAETDDNFEWIPNPNQKGVIPNVQVTPQMVAGWGDFLNEAELLLQGKKLIPFWRAADPRGINLRKVFTEPRKFDLVLWVQGTDAAPYLEEGPVTTPEVWFRLNRLFNGQFLGFAFWFN